MGQFVDLIGQRFGRLVVIEYAGSSKWKDSLWKCECDCGNTKIVRSGMLRSTHTKSCGCLQNGRRKKFGESSFQALYRSYISGAKRRGYIFSIDIETFRHLTSSPCRYCGSPPSTPMTKFGCYGEYLYNGLDRIDNHLGYVHNNIVPCCWRCNKLKGTFSQDEFIQAIKNIYSHSLSRD